MRAFSIYRRVGSARAEDDDAHRRIGIRRDVKQEIWRLCRAAISGDACAKRRIMSLGHERTRQ